MWGCRELFKSRRSTTWRAVVREQQGSAESGVKAQSSSATRHRACAVIEISARSAGAEGDGVRSPRKPGPGRVGEKQQGLRAGGRSERAIIGPAATRRPEYSAGDGGGQHHRHGTVRARETYADAKRVEVLAGSARGYAGSWCSARREAGATASERASAARVRNGNTNI